VPGDARREADALQNASGALGMRGHDDPDVLVMNQSEVLHTLA
jgi:hypothetical protein